MSESRDWQDRVAALIAELAPGVDQRDAEGSAPGAEASLLRKSGLLTLGLPRDLGGGGETISTELDVVRRLARIDASAATLLGYHYMHLRRLSLQAHDHIWQRAARETAQRNLLWGGAGNPRDNPVALSSAGDGYLATGTKFFATGAQVADRILFNGADASGQALLVFADQAADTIVHPDDWNGIGLRRSASGSIRFAGAAIPAAHIAADIVADPTLLSPYAALSEPVFQALFVFLYVGIAEGSLAIAADYTRKRSRPALGSKVETAVQDPYVVEQYGRLAAGNAAAAALALHAAQRLEVAIAAGDHLTRQERDAVNGIVSAAKHQADQVALAATAGAFELTGARAAVRGHPIERFWRDARTHTLHDAVSYRRFWAGEQYLGGNEAVFLP